MKIIEVGKRRLPCKVDDEYYDWLVSLGRWDVIMGYGVYYAFNSNLGLMHRLIYTKHYGPIELKLLIDHKNRDSLDNQILNLRKATKAQNLSNSPKPNVINPSSRFKGVSWNSRDHRWQARISDKNKTVSLGNYLSELEAAIAYNNGAIALRGEFAYLNDLSDYVE